MRTKLRGDTVIEVILAVAIFSMVVVGSFVVMNNGVAMAQRSLEINLVRQQIDSQAEILRYVHARAMEDGSGHYFKIWNEIKDRNIITGQADSLLNAEQCPTKMPTKGLAFVAPTEATSKIKYTENYVFPTTYAKVELGADQSEGLSMQISRVTDGGQNAYDAYIQACWSTPGSSKPVTLGTIVRLYDPKA